MSQDAWGGSWGTSWGLSWTRSGVTPPVVEAPIVGGFWKEDALKPKRREHKPNVDRAALRAMLEDAFEGPRPAPIREVVAAHRVPKSAPKQAYGVDWSALLDNVDAQVKVLRAYEAKLAAQRNREERVAQVAAMRKRLERRRRMRRVVVRMIVAGAH